jgi:ribose/xylose/arabinose/galactoside ABC-type transport system permease subunit
MISSPLELFNFPSQLTMIVIGIVVVAVVAAIILLMPGNKNKDK